MVQDVHVKLNPGCHGKSSNQQEGNSFHKHTGLTFKEEASKVLKSYAVKDKRSSLHTSTMKRRGANWFGHILCRNCLLKHVMEGMKDGRIEVTGRRGRCTKLLYNLKEQRGYWKLKEKSLDCTLWRTCFGRGYGTVTRQMTERMNSHFLNLISPTSL
jgi:hypothetical protein